MPINRPIEIADFLDRQHWGEASLQAFDGDFSPRRYARLTKPSGETAIFMDADADQKTPQFVSVATLLQQIGIRVPKIYAADAEHGLVLLEDFGTRNVGALLDAGEACRPFFFRAADILARLHRGFDGTAAPGLDLPLYTSELFTTQAELFLDAYIPFAHQRQAGDDERQDFRAAWRAVLRPLETMPKSLLLRDFMPDNVMDLADGEMGVLDFQDAGIGCVAYDLASLCEEVRRDGGFALLPDVVAHYREKAQNAPSQAELIRACTILSAQRHTRILGLIAQRALKAGRRDKLDFLPRIRQHLRSLLNETYLVPVRAWMSRFESKA